MTVNSAQDPDNKYGYEDPDAASYGYEDPDAAAGRRCEDQALESFERKTRRSSMKTEGSTQRRRASIQITGEVDVYLPGSKDPVRRRTSIDFMAEPHVVDDAESHNKAERRDSWYHQAEYDKIEKDNKKIVKSMEKGTDKNFCSRGLENMFTSSHQDDDRQQARKTVLEEQKLQRSEGIFDEGRISDRYHMITLDNRIEAVDRAEADDADARKILHHDRKLWKKQELMMRRRESC